MRKCIISQKVLSTVLALVLMAAMALTMTACSEGEGTTVTTTQPITTTTTATKPTAIQLGMGQTSFTFFVVGKDKNKTEFKIFTDEATVGETLLNLSLIEGEQQGPGFYVKSVNGITADYDVDGTYWAFYINGEYATSGVDTTEVIDGATYEFRVQK